MQLQKYPLGLLGALALKVTGRAPPVFSDALVPVVDVYDQYLAQGELQRVGQTITLLAATKSITGQQSVPAGKCWRLLGFGQSFVINAADVALSYVGSLSITTPGGAGTLGLFNEVAIGFDTGRATAFTLPRPIFLPSGWGVNFGAFTTAAAPANNVIVACGILVQEFDQ